MKLLVLGLVLFLGGHAVSMKRDLRASLIARFGDGGYKALYSIVSLLGFVLIVYGFGSYRASGYIPVWEPPAFTRHIAALLNLPIFILLASVYLPGRIKAMAKHPMLLAVKIWATAHLISNGDLGSMLLFGSFLAWAVMARIAAKRRPDALAWLAALGGRPRFGRNDYLAVATGIVAYVVFALWLHPLLIGVSVTGR